MTLAISRASLAAASLALVSLACSPSTDRPTNFAVVEAPSTTTAGLYRGGRPTPSQIAAMKRNLGLRTIVRLNRGDATAEREAARRAGIRLVEIPIDPKKIGSGDRATDRALERAYETFVDPANAPVYVHCDHGRDRAGLVVALYRTRQQRWPIDRVDRELAQHGHGRFMRRYLPGISRYLRTELRPARP